MDPLNVAIDALYRIANGVDGVDGETMDMWDMQDIASEALELISNAGPRD